MNIINRYKRTLLLATAAVAAVCLSGCGGEDNPGGGSGSYDFVSIGGKKWMKRNLDIETGNSWCYENNPDNCAKYGRLYDWATANKACPSGWKLPEAADWDRLTDEAGGWEDAGKRLKSSSDWDGTDDYGFAALPGGYCSTGGSRFYYAGDESAWWTATKRDNTFAYYRSIGNGYDDIQGDARNVGFGFSVRCVK